MRPWWTWWWRCCWKRWYLMNLKVGRDSTAWAPWEPRKRRGMVRRRLGTLLKKTIGEWFVIFLSLAWCFGCLIQPSGSVSNFEICGRGIYIYIYYILYIYYIYIIYILYIYIIYMHISIQLNITFCGWVHLTQWVLHRSTIYVQLNTWSKGIPKAGIAREHHEPGPKRNALRCHQAWQFNISP